MSGELTDARLLEIAAELLERIDLAHEAFVRYADADGADPEAESQADAMEAYMALSYIVDGQWTYAPCAVCTAGAVIYACARNGAPVERALQLIDAVGMVLDPEANCQQTEQPRNRVFRWNDGDPNVSEHVSPPTKAEAVAVLRLTAAVFRNDA